MFGRVANDGESDPLKHNRNPLVIINDTRKWLQIKIKKRN